MIRRNAAIAALQVSDYSSFAELCGIPHFAEYGYE